MDRTHLSSRNYGKNPEIKVGAKHFTFLFRKEPNVSGKYWLTKDCSGGFMNPLNQNIHSEVNCTSDLSRFPLRKSASGKVDRFWACKKSPVTGVVSHIWINICDMTQTYMWHDSFKYMLHDSTLCVTYCVTHMNQARYIYESNRLHIW